MEMSLRYISYQFSVDAAARCMKAHCKTWYPSFLLGPLSIDQWATPIALTRVRAIFWRMIFFCSFDCHHVLMDTRSILQHWQELIFSLQPAIGWPNPQLYYDILRSDGLHSERMDALRESRKETMRGLYDSVMNSQSSREHHESRIHCLLGADLDGMFIPVSPRCVSFWNTICL
jgi:hypothetical protein